MLRSVKKSPSQINARDDVYDRGTTLFAENIPPLILCVTCTTRQDLLKFQTCSSDPNVPYSLTLAARFQPVTCTLCNKGLHIRLLIFIAFNHAIIVYILRVFVNREVKNAVQLLLWG